MSQTRDELRNGISDNEIEVSIDRIINNLEHNNTHVKAASAVRILGAKHDNKKAKKVLNDLDIKKLISSFQNAISLQ